MHPPESPLSLLAFGADATVRASFAALAAPFGDEARLGRVVSMHYGGAFVMLEGPVRSRLPSRETEEQGLVRMLARPSGLLRRAAREDALGRPAVGDFVVVTPAEDGEGVLAAILPRRTVLVRKAAGEGIVPQVLVANVDTVVVVSALGAGGDWSAARAERYLRMIHEGGGRPLLLLTKADVATAEERVATLAEATELFGAEGVLVTSLLEPSGAAALRARLRPGETTAFLGSSGVGKSTLLNALAGAPLARAGDVREKDGKGRHTTTHRELFQLGDGALVIDTPGMREVGLFSEDEEHLALQFPDIAELSADCRYVDCRHGDEPGCAVRVADRTRKLPKGRLDAFVRARDGATAARRERTGKGPRGTKERRRP